MANKIEDSSGSLEDAGDIPVSPELDIEKFRRSRSWLKRMGDSLGSQTLPKGNQTLLTETGMCYTVNLPQKPGYKSSK